VEHCPSATFRQGSASRAPALDGRDETVAAARHALDEPRVPRGVPERQAQPLHRRVDALVEPDDRPVRPEELLDALAAEGLAGRRDQGRQDLE
jgi:hypothetical protein